MGQQVRGIGNWAAVKMPPMIGGSDCCQGIDAVEAARHRPSANVPISLMKHSSHPPCYGVPDWDRALRNDASDAPNSSECKLKQSGLDRRLPAWRRRRHTARSARARISPMPMRLPVRPSPTRDERRRVASVRLDRIKTSLTASADCPQTLRLHQIEH